MKPIKFTIPGHPVPCLRITQGQVKLMRIPDHKLSKKSLAVKDKIRRYFDYKDVVAAIFMDNGITRKPTSKIKMDIVIYFANKRQPDCSNVFKAVEDGAFDQDKYVAGSFDFFYDKENPRVEVSISE